ncbi:MAG: FAD-binding protein [Pseudomonadota bacterium]
MSAASIISPKSEADVSKAVTQAAANDDRLRLTGGGTRMEVGRPSQYTKTLDLSGLSGITLYEPSEMIIGAWAGTPVADIDAALAQHNQMLTFEPVDYRDLMGTKGEPTIGAAVASNNSGPRRIYAGAARDSLIGVRFVNGSGEVVKNGGRVMKNVTGLDLVKLQAGAWGTLGVLTEVIFKVLPRPETVVTLVLDDLDDNTAVKAMCAAMATPYEVTGAAHQPGSGLEKAGSKTWLRIEGMAESVRYREGKLADALSGFGLTGKLEGPQSDAVWRAVRDVGCLKEQNRRTDMAERAVWRVSLPPTKGPDFVAASGALSYFYDWSGGLIWMTTDLDVDTAAIHALAASLGGHALLVRAPVDVRAKASVFQPQPAAIAQLNAGIKASFDPLQILNPGLMVPEAAR